MMIDGIHQLPAPTYFYQLGTSSVLGTRWMLVILVAFSEDKTGPFIGDGKF